MSEVRFARINGRVVPLRKDANSKKKAGLAAGSAATAGLALNSRREAVKSKSFAGKANKSSADAVSSFKKTGHHYGHNVAASNYAHKSWNALGKSRMYKAAAITALILTGATAISSALTKNKTGV